MVYGWTLALCLSAASPVIDGDPTADITALRRVALVIKGDRAYYPSEIYEALGIKPFAEPLRYQSVGR